jgi:lysozyme family protein
VFGAATCAALQRALNVHGVPVTVDGAFGPETTRALQTHLGVAVDGEIGPRTIKALQHRLGAPEDGEWGPETTRFLQRALNANAF